MGWLVAVLGGAVISLVLNLLYGLVTGFAVQRVVFTLSVVSIYLVSGFQAYLVSGYLVARLARRSGGLNGLIALFGLVTGLILAIVLGRLRCGLPRGCRGASCLFRVATEALLVGLLLFCSTCSGATWADTWASLTGRIAPGKARAARRA